MSVVPASRPPASEEIELTGRLRWVRLLGEAASLARAIKDTEFVPKTLRGNEAAITAAIMYGDEVGLPPMAALAKIAVIDGKPSMAAEAQRALILAAGHAIWPEDYTTSKVTWRGKRSDGVEAAVTWTLDNARSAGLAGKPNWKGYPRAMLSARASAELARAIFADVIGGLAAIEELDPDALPGEAATEPAPEEQPKTTSRKRAAARPNPPVIAPPPAITPPSAPETPEPPLPEDEPAEPADAGKMTPPQRARMMALFREKGMGDDDDASRDKRLLWVNNHIERVIQSATELTDVEASVLIGELEQIDPPAPGVIPGQTSILDADPGPEPR